MAEQSRYGQRNPSAHKREFHLKRSPLFYKSIFSIGKPLINWYYDIHCEGAGLIPDKGPAFVAIKHINALDILVVAVSIERQMNILQNEEFAGSRLAQYILDRAGGIAIDRENTLSATTKEAMRYSKWLLNNEEVLALFPEMTRICGYVGKIHPDLITHYNRSVRPVPTFCAGIWYEDPVDLLKRNNRIELRIERAEMEGSCLEEIADSMGRQMARLSRVEYLPELSPKYVDKKGIMG